MVPTQARGRLGYGLTVRISPSAPRQVWSGDRPGKPDKSPLVRRIESDDPKERMPPPEARHSLKPEQIALLRQWVKEGAVYEEHWSFIPPKRPATPQPKNPHWAKTPIDNFILSRLDKEGLDSCRRG